jgi:biopolymer transport protein ExbD
MNFRTRHSDLDVEINLTPLIDVVFLLLIFFMVTTTFSKEAQIKLELPEATSSEKANPDDLYLTIQISQFGEYAVKGADDTEPRELINSSHKTLQRTLRLAARNMVDPVVLIRADRLTPHEAVIKAMDAARRQGFYQITFSTDNAE